MISQDSTRSDTIVQQYLQREPKLARKYFAFSGSWRAKPEDVFPLLCPAREADWIPGWNARVLYSSTGYAEDKCIFETDETCVVGAGLWTFTGFEKNDHVQFVRFERDAMTHARITVNDNGDGTTTATWRVAVTALNQEGNERVAQMDRAYGAGLVQLIDRYLEQGEMAQDRSLLARLHAHVKGH